jgi:YidC/Oxa1 family membrane protein insertase
MDKQRQLLIFLAVGLLSFGVIQFFAKPSSRPAVSQTTPSAPGTKNDDARLARERQLAARTTTQQVGTIETREFRATATNLNAALRSFRMKEERYVTEGEGIDLVTTDREEFLPLRIELGGVPIPDDAVWQMEQISETGLRFTWEGGGFRVIRKLEAGRGPYQLWSTVTVTNTSAGPRPVRVNVDSFHYVSLSAEGGGFLSSFSRPPEISQTICRSEGDVIRRVRDKLESAERYPAATFAGIENAHFAMVVATQDENAEACTMSASPRGGTVSDPAGTLFHSRLVYPRMQLAPGETKTVRSLAYFGPKLPSMLSSAGHSLHSAIDLGFFAVIGRYLVLALRTVHDLPFVQNWGFAIILLTILVRICLFPLTQPQIRSMARMRQLKPELDKLNELYGEDREKKGAATMELYRKHGINPVAGCLPTLMQLPVWFAFYTSLSTNVELFRAPFFGWLTDLSAPDPFFILPIIYAGTMVIQQKLTPNTMDPVQAKMMLWMMPTMMLVFTLFLPQGLVIYMLTNAVLGLGQQQYIEHRLKKAASSSPPAAAV